MSTEGQAWEWLLQLERLPWQDYSVQRTDSQIIIRAVPGKLGEIKGAPYVQVTYAVPQLNGERVKGTGNSLANACAGLYYRLRDKEIDVPMLPAEVAFSGF